VSVTEKDSLPFLNLRHSLSLSKQSQEQLPLVNVRTENFLGQMQLQQTNKLNNPHPGKLLAAASARVLHFCQHLCGTLLLK
jgi:hypothetical protein